MRCWTTTGPAITARLGRSPIGAERPRNRRVENPNNTVDLDLAPNPEPAVRALLPELTARGVRETAERPPPIQKTDYRNPLGTAEIFSARESE